MDYAYDLCIMCMLYVLYLLGVDYKVCVDYAYDVYIICVICVIYKV